MPVLNKNNIGPYLESIISNIILKPIISIKYFIETMTNLKWNTIDDIKHTLKQFNNKKLYDISIERLNEIESFDSMKLKNEIENMKKQYICYRNTGRGIEAMKYLKNEIIEIFGYDYRFYDPNNIYDKYKEDQVKNYNKIIQEIYNKFNENKRLRLIL